MYYVSALSLHIQSTDYDMTEHIKTLNFQLFTFLKWLRAETLNLLSDWKYNQAPSYSIAQESITEINKKTPTSSVLIA